MATNKEKYRALCETEESIPLFQQHWWLDAVTVGKRWDVLLTYDADGEICAAWPYLYGRKFGLTYVTSPQLTQYGGIWQKRRDFASEKERLSYEKKLYTNLAKQLLRLNFAFFQQKFPLTFTNWLPLYWQGFEQTTHYTYRIDDLRNLETVFANFDYAKRMHIRKAEKRFQVRFDMSAHDFYRLQCLQLHSRHDKNMLSEALTVNLIETARRRGQGFIVSAEDECGTPHAALFVPYDRFAAYDLISAIHPDHRGSGASSLVVWEAIKKVAPVTQAFDFEGSMIEGVESSFRQFGARQTPYFQITKSRKWLQMLSLLCR